MLTPRRHFRDAHKNNQTMIFEGKQHTMEKITIKALLLLLLLLYFPSNNQVISLRNEFYNYMTSRSRPVPRGLFPTPNYVIQLIIYKLKQTCTYYDSTTQA